METTSFVLRLRPQPDQTEVILGDAVKTLEPLGRFRLDPFLGIFNSPPLGDGSDFHSRGDI
jgi:hypothetical protein